MAEITLQLSNPRVGYALISLCEYVVCLSPALTNYNSWGGFTWFMSWKVCGFHAVFPLWSHVNSVETASNTASKKTSVWTYPKGGFTRWFIVAEWTWILGWIRVQFRADSCLNSASIHLNGNSAGQYWRHRFFHCGFQKNGSVNSWCGIHARQARCKLAPSPVVWTYPYRTSFKLVS